MKGFLCRLFSGRRSGMEEAEVAAAIAAALHLYGNECKAVQNPNRGLMMRSRTVKSEWSSKRFAMNPMPQRNRRWS